MTEPVTPSTDGPGRAATAHRHRDYGRLVALGLAAVSLAAVTELISMPSLDSALWVAIYCFAVAIPVNTAFGLMVHPDSGVASAVVARRSLLAIYAVGVVVAFAGFTAVFVHFSRFLGVLFLASAVVVVLILAHLTGEYADARTRVRRHLEKMGL
jgi:hypothetical protein